ncbi:hypothetical protein PsyrCH409_06275 [Pseudomonas viridiflava]|nr:hypothetical protein PsyrCH409_06275 [Pseudomonas viridiflava]
MTLLAPPFIGASLRPPIEGVFSAQPKQHIVASDPRPGGSRLSRPTWPTLDFVAGCTFGESKSRSELNLRNHYS